MVSASEQVAVVGGGLSSLTGWGLGTWAVVGVGWMVYKGADGIWVLQRTSGRSAPAKVSLPPSPSACIPRMALNANEVFSCLHKVEKYIQIHFYPKYWEFLIWRPGCCHRFATKCSRSQTLYTHKFGVWLTGRTLDMSAWWSWTGGFNRLHGFPQTLTRWGPSAPQGPPEAPEEFGIGGHRSGGQRQLYAPLKESMAAKVNEINSFRHLTNRMDAFTEN